MKVRFVKRVDLTGPIRSALEGAGWSVTSDNNWQLLWSGKYPKLKHYLRRRPGRLIRHFFGEWILDNKYELHRTFQQAASRLALRGQAPRYDFHPMTFALPEEYGDFRNEAARRPEARWIVKPAGEGEGRGIRLLEKYTDLVVEPGWIVQEYIAHPHLLDGFRYTLRVFLLVTSLDPLLAYIYPDGLVKCTARPYTSDPTVTDPLVHITNTEVVRTDPEGDGTARNLSLDAFRHRLRGEGFDDDLMWNAVRRLAIATVIAARDRVLGIQRTVGMPDGRSFELVGLDIALDEDLKPWLLECNTNPVMSVRGASGSGYALTESIVKMDVLDDLAALLHAVADWERRQATSLDDFNHLERVIARADVEYAVRGRFERIFPAADVAEHFDSFPFPRHFDIALARREHPGFVPAAPVLRPGKVRAELEGEGLVLTTPEGEVLHTLNPTAAYVLAASEDGLSVQDMVHELTMQFPDTGDCFEHDVRKVMADFLDSGILEDA